MAKPAQPSPFDLLGVPPQFDLDATDLRQRYLAASAKTHPDRFTDPLEQAEAAERASAINAAYRTLSDPAQRAKALLMRRGVWADLDSAQLPPALLMEVMEVREELEEALAAGDQPTIDRLRQWAAQQREAHLAQLADHFGSDEPDVDAVRQTLAALRYVERMQAAAEIRT
jgi:molecular chaperone HscB